MNPSLHGTYTLVRREIITKQKIMVIIIMKKIWPVKRDRKRQIICRDSKKATVLKKILSRVWKGARTFYGCLGKTCYEINDKNTVL